MNTVTTYTHTFNEQNEIIGKRVNAVYYLPDDCASYVDVPIGSTFEVVYPESQRSVLFEVISHQVPKVDKEACRYYRPLERR